MGLAAVLVLVAAGCACDVDLGAVGGPGDGTASARLDVGADPSTGLEDGTVVRVVGAGFDPDETITGDAGGGIIVGVALCLSEADTERRGVDACDTDSGYRYAATPEGVLDVTFPVPRVITVGGVAYDCAEQAGRCLLVAANASDYDNSGGTPLTFREDLPRLEDAHASSGRAASDQLPIFSDPTGPFAPDVRVELAASGFQPGEPLLLATCGAGFADGDDPQTVCEPDDTTDALGALMFRSLPTGGPTAADDGTAVVHLSAAERVRPYAGDAIDCTAEAGACVWVVAAAADTKRSAVLPYEIEG